MLINLKTLSSHNFQLSEVITDSISSLQSMLEKFFLPCGQECLHPTHHFNLCSLGNSQTVQWEYEPEKQGLGKFQSWSTVAPFGMVV